MNLRASKLDHLKSVYNKLGCLLPFLLMVTLLTDLLLGCKSLFSVIQLSFIAAIVSVCCLTWNHAVRDVCILRLRPHNYITKMLGNAWRIHTFSDYTSCHQCKIIVHVVLLWRQKHDISKASSRVHISGSRPKGNPQGTSPRLQPRRHHTLVPRPPPFYLCLQQCCEPKQKGRPRNSIIHHKLC